MNIVLIVLITLVLLSVVLTSLVTTVIGIVCRVALIKTWHRWFYGVLCFAIELGFLRWVMVELYPLAVKIYYSIILTS